MAGEKDDEEASPRDEVGGLSGLVESDDTTQADAGMVAGTGTAEGQATVHPQGTEDHDAEAEEAGEAGED